MTLSKKQFGAILSVGLNCFLIAMKLAVGIISGSISVLASAIDSIVDLVASLFAFYGIQAAEEPPDAEHPFGHGKFEDFAGLCEAVLIIVGACFIIWEAVQKFIVPQHITVEPMAGIIVMVVSLILDFIVSQVLFRIARETESTALEADAHHLSTDVFSSVAVIIGLILVKVTGNSIFDPLTALVVAGLILSIGVNIIRKVFSHLMDTALPQQEMQKIIDIVHHTMPQHETIRIDSLRTRRSGSHRLIVFNLQVSPEMTVAKAHEYCDQLEAALENAFPNSLITIHVEPLPKDQDILISEQA